MSLAAWDLLCCFGRTYLVTAAFNPRGLQNIGQIHVLDPVLAKIHGEGEALREARARYVGHANCHPFLVPVLTGIILHLEAAVAQKRLNPRTITQIRDATANSLSAIGDSLFSGSLAALWALVCACLILEHAYATAAGLTLALFLLLQAFRLGGFILGLRRGLRLLVLVRDIDPMEWAERIKMGSAVAAAIFLHLCLRGAPVVQVVVGLLLLLICRRLALTRIPRVIIACCLILVMIYLARLDIIPTLDAFTTP